MINVENVLRGYIECALWSSQIGEDFAAEWAKRTGEYDHAPDVSLQSFGFAADDLDADALAKMREDVESFCAMPSAWPDSEAGVMTKALEFWSANASGKDWTGDEQIGHDFWLTRNGHGAGFWDRFYTRDGRSDGESYGALLTEVSEPYGEQNLYAYIPEGARYGAEEAQIGVV